MCVNKNSDRYAHVGLIWLHDDVYPCSKMGAVRTFVYVYHQQCSKCALLNRYIDVYYNTITWATSKISRCRYASCIASRRKWIRVYDKVKCALCSCKTSAANVTEGAGLDCTSGIPGRYVAHMLIFDPISWPSECYTTTHSCWSRSRFITCQATCYLLHAVSLERKLQHKTSKRMYKDANQDVLHNRYHVYYTYVIVSMVLVVEMMCYVLD